MLRCFGNTHVQNLLATSLNSTYLYPFKCTLGNGWKDTTFDPDAYENRHIWLHVSRALNDPALQPWAEPTRSENRSSRRRQREKSCKPENFAILFIENKYLAWSFKWRPVAPKIRAPSFLGGNTPSRQHTSMI